MGPITRYNENGEDCVGGLIAEFMQTVLETTHARPANGHAKANGTPKPFRWTVDQYYRMGDLGFFYGKRVQLIKGEIIEMAPMGTPHATSVQLAYTILETVFGKGYVVRSQLPMSFGKIDEPEPDAVVVRGSIRDFAGAHPSSAELIVEVADTSLRLDRTKKLALYAENLIGEYWILKLKKRCLEVYRQPRQDENLGFSYAEMFVLTEDESICPIAKPESSIKVSEMLP